MVMRTNANGLELQAWDARKFVARVLCEYPFLLEQFAVQSFDNLIAYMNISKYEHLRYRSWQEAKPVVQKRVVLKIRSSQSKLKSADERYIAYMPTQQ
jgi:hypothetical protein